MAKNTPRIALASPLHDPKKHILPYLRKYGTALRKIYDGNVCVSTTRDTHEEVLLELKKLKYHTYTHRNSRVAENYRHAIKMCLDIGSLYIHQIDFDRALHWIRRFPTELADVVEVAPSYPGILCFIRSKRAFETHPLTQRSTEVIANEIASKAAGVTVDIMSGSYGFERRLAQKILKEGKRQDYGFYAEFLKIALKHKFPINTLEVEGLEWETPDQYHDIIKKKGYKEWLKEFEDLSEWEKRVRLLEESADTLT